MFLIFTLISDMSSEPVDKKDDIIDDEHGERYTWSQVIDKVEDTKRIHK